ncbi:thymidylate synthase [Acinetobacter phage AM24]|nr:thymidylate synthase [Acinetobacter phage AM24]
MSLTKEFFERDTNITAKVIADSISPSGQRITTFEVEYPRFILAELNTHKMLEKNSSSSRAIPIIKMIEQIETNGATPLYWGKTKSGMQAGEEVVGNDLSVIQYLWDLARSNAVASADILSQMGLHKQTSNRLLEPFQMMKTVITGTDWDNFFNLRIHPDSQPEFCMLAYKMYMAMKESTPVKLVAGQWHLPFVHTFISKEGVQYYSDGINPLSGGKQLSLEEAIRVSASCCAQTSYRKSDDSLEKADKIFDMLIKADVLHASPFGHLATPVREYWQNPKPYLDDVNSMDYSTWEKGITHMNRKGVLCSGNLTGWISYRHLIPNNTCYEFDFEERMKLFSDGSVS